MRRGAPSCFPVLSRTPDASWGSFEGLWGSILASGVPPGSLLGASWAPSWGPRASKSAPKAPRKPTKSGQARPKSAPRGPKQPQATRSFIFDRFGSPFRLDCWSPGASKISKKCRTVVKNQGFRGLAPGARKRPEKAPKRSPKSPPRQAQNPRYIFERRPDLPLHPLYLSHSEINATSIGLNARFPSPEV